MGQEDLSAYNVIAAFPEEAAARRAVYKLHEEGFDAKRISYLGSAAQERSEDQGSDHPGTPAGTATEEVPPETAKSVAGGGAAGATVGGAAGFFAGLAAIGIPGAGPLIGAGVWAALAGGATAGAVAGGVGGGIVKMWELHYKDSVASGGALVGAHSDDQAEVHRAAQLLAAEHPTRVDHIDPEGNILDE